LVGTPGSSRLHDLGPDAEVTAARQDDSAAVFRVTRVKEYPKDEFPTDVVYGDLDRRTAVDQLLRRQHRRLRRPRRDSPHITRMSSSPPPGASTVERAE
jgi:hypothetical protein